MGHAYVPGLKVAGRTLLRKERRLPLKGEVLVNAGDRVTAETVVARTHLPGRVELVNVSNQLGIDPKMVKKSLLKKEGEKISKGEVLARNAGLFGLFKSESVSPLDGFVETVSDATGKVTLRENPIPVDLKAFVEGEIESVIPEEGVVVRTLGAYLQGIFGIGGETWGTLKVVVSSPDDVLDEEKLDESLSGCVVVGGSHVTIRAMQKGARLGINAIIAGGIDDAQLREFLGYDLGVAITGTEEKGITVVITEGFGKIRMAEKSFNLLKECEGHLASANGATQIRAGVIRPEVIVPFMEEGIAQRGDAREDAAGELVKDSPVRIIREPNFGEQAKVVSLPTDPVEIETGARVRVVEIRMGNGTTVTVPRANVEMIEE